MHVGLYVMRL